MINYSRIKQHMLRNFNRPRIGCRDEDEEGVDNRSAARHLKWGWVMTVSERQPFWGNQLPLAHPLRNPPFCMHPNRQTFFNKRTKRIQEYRRRFSRS